MKIVNKRIFFSNLDKRFKEIPKRNLRRACQRAADVVRNEAVQSITGGSKTGDTVRKYNPTRTHTQSAAGEPPASDTGFLVANITATTKAEGKKIIGEVKASAPYAVHLEFGTTAMQARPFLQPALEKNSKKIQTIFVAEGIII